MVSKFDINLDDELTHYLAGNSIRGNLELVVKETLAYQEILVSIEGECEIRLHMAGKHAKPEHIQLVNTSTTLQVADDDTLPPGKHTFPFTAKVPSDSPSSFRGLFGDIRYLLKAAITRPWSKDITNEISIKIKGLLDLNTEPGAKKSWEAEADAWAGLACCPSGPMSGVLHIQRKGYVSGENIGFRVSAHNKTKIAYSCEVQLQQTITYTSGNKSRQSHSVIKTSELGEIAQGAQNEWCDELKGIPKIPPSRLGASNNYIDVVYKLSFIATATGRGESLNIPLDLTVGTVPLKKESSN